MKKLVSGLCLCLCTLTQIEGQVSFGFKAGTSPSVNPGTNHLILNRNDPGHAMLFNITNVKYGQQYGLSMRYDRGPWFLMTELLVASSKTEYSFAHIGVGEDRSTQFATEKRLFADLPVSVGVHLGPFNVFSGVTATRDINFRTELNQIEGYSSQLSSWRMGWHSGVGIEVHNVTLDLRYQQTFYNYGQDRFVNGQELLLRNSPGRVVALIGINI